MATKNNLSRMTIDISKEEHRQLKAIAAMLGKSMRELVIESLKKHLKSIPFETKKTL